jgi:hypothetical protein
MGGLNAMDTYHDYFHMSVSLICGHIRGGVLTSIGNLLAAAPVSHLQSTISGPSQLSSSPVLSMITGDEGQACLQALSSSLSVPVFRPRRLTGECFWPAASSWASGCPSLALAHLATSLRLVLFLVSIELAS